MSKWFGLAILFSIFLNGCATMYCYKIGATKDHPEWEYHCLCGDLEETWIVELSFDKTEGYKRLIEGSVMNNFKITFLPFNGIVVKSYIPGCFGKQKDFKKNGYKVIRRWYFNR